jgi:hypothetical protein
MITIALWADSKMLGLRCAKIKYGVDMIDEVLQGYSYHGRNGRLIVRVSKGEVEEDDTCDKCECPLYACNAREVRV